MLANDRVARSSALANGVRTRAGMRCLSWCRSKRNEHVVFARKRWKAFTKALVESLLIDSSVKTDDDARTGCSAPLRVALPLAPGSSLVACGTIEEPLDGNSLPIQPSAEREATFSMALRRDIGPGSPFIGKRSNSLHVRGTISQACRAFAWSWPGGRESVMVGAHHMDLVV